MLTVYSIGRITEGLLLLVSETVDIVEPIAKFSSALQGKDGVGEIFNVGLEDWSPSSADESKYDLIWNQWCLGHLTDAQLIEYLQKCGKVLRDGGWIIVKENLVGPDGEDVFDELDSSVTRYVGNLVLVLILGEGVLSIGRTDEKFRSIFRKAGLKLHKTELQRGLPAELYPVRTYALQPE
jgi:protein N-terminal methyltransferase